MLTNISHFSDIASQSCFIYTTQYTNTYMAVMVASCVCMHILVIFRFTCIECCIRQPLSSCASSVVILSNVVLGVSVSSLSPGVCR